jgi:hypothetical protein
VVDRQMMAGQPEKVGPTFWAGTHAVTATATWRGHAVGGGSWTYTVPSPAFDLDEDGVTDRQGDCDDHDVFVRPGLPDVAGDGRDNDCDGKNADDADGDGYPASKSVVLTAAQKDKITAVYGVAAADRLVAWKSLTPRIPVDCNDGDANVHPFAANAAKSCKAPVTVAAEPATATPGPEAAVMIGAARGDVPLKADISTAGPTWYALEVVGVESVTDLKLKVELEGGDYWIELWDGGRYIGTNAGPLAQRAPIFEVESDRRIELPRPKEATWTGSMWNHATDAGALTPFAMLGAAFMTPLTAVMDLGDASAKNAARARGKIGPDTLLYVRVVPVGPGDRHGTMTLQP